METFLHDISWATALRHEALTPIFLGLTALGYTTFFLIALPVLYWAWDTNKATRLALIVLASAFLNAFLKDLWQDPRPDALLWLDPTMIEDGDTSYGMPSGHTQVGIVMWLWLAYEIRKAWAWIAGALIAGGIAFSRLYLGVHDVQDVIVGAGIGGVTLLAYHWTRTAHFNWWRELSFPARFTTLALFFVALALRWPDGIGGAAALIGFFLAWYAGAALDRARIRFQPGPGLWRRVVTSVIGIVAVFIVFETLGHLQEKIAPESAWLSALNGTLVAVTVVALLPLAFQSVLLARRSMP